MTRFDLFGVGALLMSVLAFGYGCTDDEAPEDNDVQGGMGGTPVMTSTGTMMPTTTTGAGGAMDEGTSCADAVPLEEQTNTLGGTFYDFTAVLADPGDIDYFTFEADAGEWIRVSTDTETGSPINPVVTLFNEDGSTQLAQNNNEFGASGFDSELAFRVLETGTYCMEVQEWSTWTGNTPEGGPTFIYRAIMVPVDFDLYDFNNEELEPNDSTAAPQIEADISFSVGQTSLQISTDFSGTFATATDVDVYEWTAPVSALGFNIVFTPGGIDGFGSTTEPGIINVYEGDGATVLSTLDVQMGADRFSSVPIVAGNKYFIEVNPQVGMTAGANDFYYLRFNTRNTVNEQEMDDVANNVDTGAQAATGELDGATTRHFIGGGLDVSGGSDTDWWTFQAPVGAEVAVACSSWRSGSGTRDATFAVFDNPQGAALQTETETESADVLWSTSSSASNPVLTMTTAGTHYFRASATTQDPGVTSAFYICGIHVTP